MDIKSILAVAALSLSILAGCPNSDELHDDARKVSMTVKMLEEGKSFYTGTWNDPIGERTAFFHYLTRHDCEGLSSWEEHFASQGYNVEHYKKTVRSREVYADVSLMQMIFDYNQVSPEHQQYFREQLARNR